MEVRIENGEVGNARKQPQCFAHDVNSNRRVQRRKLRVAFNLVDQLRSDALIFLHRRPAANHAMADGRRSREFARVQCIGHQLESDGAVGKRRCLIDQLFARSILDPKLAQIGADAVDRALVQLFAARRCRLRTPKI